MRLLFSLCVVLCAVVSRAENLLSNSSFEKKTSERIVGWDWDPGAARATCHLDEAVARSGKASIRIANPSPGAPNVFGSLTQTVRVCPKQRYALSCYVKTDGCGCAWIGGGRRWEHRFSFPAKTEGWQRVTGSFATGEGETQFTVRLNTDSETAGLWIDDIALESGEKATDYVYEAPLKPGEARLRLEPFSPGDNLVPNSSFEEADGAQPKSWIWEPRNTDARLLLDAQNPHSGKAAVKLTNGTPFGPHVYGSLRLADDIKVKPNTSYTYSVFVKTASTAPSAWFGGGKDWKILQAIPATHGQWRRVSRTFVTDPDETTFMLRCVTDAPTDGIWVDDFSFCEGVRPVPGTLDGAALADFVDLYPVEPPEVYREGRAIGTRWMPSRWPSANWTFCGNEFKCEGLVTVADAAQPTLLEIELADAEGHAFGRQQTTLAAGVRAATVDLRTELGDRTPDCLALSARLLRGDKVIASHAGKINLVSPERIRAKLAPVAAQRDRLRASVEKLEQRGLGAASRVSLTVLDNFIPWVESDIGDEMTDRAWDEVCLLEQIAARANVKADAVLVGQAQDFPVPRYVTGKLEVSHAQTIGTLRYPDGKTARGPVVFTGYGHFGQVKQDVEKLPGYGCNILQIEFGPNSVLPNENDTDDGAINDFLAFCDRAKQANVAVCLLLSPHYFPEWALQKWPHLKECGGGFFGYCVHDPEARAVLEKSLRHLVPRIKNHPAIHSLCLSNEPVCTDLRHCRATAKAWPAWLERRHGTTATLNARWGTSYADFASVPVPKPEFKNTPECLDFVRYNEESFSEFHRWMADVIHSMAPEIPVHAKIMMGAHFEKIVEGFWSVDPEPFSAFSQYNGNDAYNMYDHDGTVWNNGWRHCQAGYDFQRSMADLPVFNTENHIIFDRDHDVIPPAHIYEALWQNAIHGQGSTAVWVWERTTDHTSDIAGSILHRPDCVEAAGRCGLDLLRLGSEVAAIQNLGPSVVLLWSKSSQVLCGDHDGQLSLAYEGANFLGQPLGFATENKLAEYARTGKLPRPLDTAKVLILPQVTNLPDDARQGLDKLRAAGMKIVVYAAGPTKSDYNQPREVGEVETLPKAECSEKAFALLREHAVAWNLPAYLQVADGAGQPVFGVEIRSAPYAGGWVASVCNHLRTPRTVTLAGHGGKPIVDLITGKALDATFVAEPMTPLLLSVR